MHPLRCIHIELGIGGQSCSLWQSVCGTMNLWCNSGLCCDPTSRELPHAHTAFSLNLLTLASIQSQFPSCCPGTVGFKNARKSQPAAAEKVAEELAKRALNLGYGSVVVKMKGAGNNKQVAVQSLHAAGLGIKTLLDVTGIPYNGCRASKRRRV